MQTKQKKSKKQFSDLGELDDIQRNEGETRAESGSSGFLLSDLLKISKEIELTKKQKSLVSLIKSKDITVVEGVWGTSKTFVVCYAALKLMQEQNGISRIIFTKPIVDAADAIGFLKGDIKNKVAPYAESFYNTFEELIGKKSILALENMELLEFKNIGYVRGATYDNSFLIADECQNLTLKQLMTFITRLGKNSKIVLIGDRHQTDIREKSSGFVELIQHVLKDIEGVGFFEFDSSDIMRSKILIDITKKYQAYKDLKKQNLN
jgi:phosphate starvation-inducible PhoH-like protein